MQWYIAAAFAHRDDVRALAEQIRNLGDTVVARWITDEHSIDVAKDGERKFKAGVYGTVDLEDVDAADGLILLTEPRNNSPHSSGVRHTEFGFALYKAMYVQRTRLVIIPDYENVFHYLDQYVERYESVAAFLAARKRELGRMVGV